MDLGKTPRHSFRGRVTRHGEGDDPFVCEVTIDDGSKAYLLGPAEMFEIHPSLKDAFANIRLDEKTHPDFDVIGKYIEWRDMKVIVELE